MVWAKTQFIGCGHSRFRERLEFKVDENQEEQDFVHRLVCNYGPAGNIIGEPVYKEGKACSSCPKGYGCSGDYGGLCSSESKIVFLFRCKMKCCFVKSQESRPCRS